MKNFKKSLPSLVVVFLSVNCLFYFFIFIFPSFLFFLPKLYFFAVDLLSILVFLTKNFFNFLNFFSNYSRNSSDIDISSNTDGEDLIAGVNDLVEISLQERSYFFDSLIANPFEAMILGSVFGLLHLLAYKIKSPINIFKKLK